MATFEYERAYMLDGRAHRFVANIHHRPKGKKHLEVVGARMACGAVMDDPAFRYEWATRRRALADIDYAALCQTCYPDRIEAARG